VLFSTGAVTNTLIHALKIHLFSSVQHCETFHAILAQNINTLIYLLTFSRGIAINLQPSIRCPFGGGIQIDSVTSSQTCSVINAEMVVRVSASNTCEEDVSFLRELFMITKVLIVILTKLHNC